MMASSGEYEYEKTMMTGKYELQLQQFARDIAAKRREEEERRRLNLEEARRKKSLTRRVLYWAQVKLFPYVLDWVFILVLGVLMAALSFAIDFLIQYITRAHSVLSLQLLEHNHLIVQYIFWVSYPVLFIVFSVVFVHVVSPHAIGSGIPEMKTVLRGVSLTDYLSFKTLISKTVALITAVGSSLPIGKEGPFVHISSMIAHIMSKFITTINRVYMNEAHNYELLAAACAVGVSCNFAAPIGGVLFSIEVTATYFAVRNYWRGFFGAVCGAFLFQLAGVWYQKESTITALFKTSFPPEFPFDLKELIVFSLIGVACGFGGALFVFYHRMYVLTRRKYRKHFYTKYLEKSIVIYPILVTVLYTSLTFPGFLGKYMAGELTQRQAVEQLFSNVTWSSLPSLEDVQELPEDSEEYQIIVQWGNPSVFLSLPLFLLVQFLFTALATTLPLPAGIFFPVFVQGAAFGRLVGEVMAVATGSPAINPGGYAVVGAAAMAGSVTHTISTAVIVFEVTGQITHILPIMIAVLIANAIASLLQPSIYDSIILIRQLPYLPDLKPNKYYSSYAADFMRTSLVYLTYQSTYGQLKHLLHSSKHSSFPLVDAPDSKVLLGSVSRHSLIRLLENHLVGVKEHAKQIEENKKNIKQDRKKLSEDNSPVESRSPSPSPGPSGELFRKLAMPSSLSKIFASEEETDSAELSALEQTLRQSTTTEALAELEEELLSQTMDFHSVQIDPAPFQLVGRTSLYKVHSLFSILNLSHAYVTNTGRLVGVVTLKDLTQAIDGRRDKAPNTSPSIGEQETEYEMQRMQDSAANPEVEVHS